MIALLLIFAAKQPDIALLHKGVRSAPAYQQIVVRGQMQGASEVEHAEIRYRARGDVGFERVELELKQGDEYEGAIPGDNVRPGELEYYVLAVDFVGKSREVFASAKRPQRVAVEEAPPPKETPPPPPPPVKVEPTPSVASTAAPKADAPASQPVDFERGSWSAAELDALGVLTLADLLERMSDVQVQRAMDGSYRVSKRGLRDAGSILVVVDGQPINSFGSGTPDLRIPVRLYERIDLALSSVQATDIAAPLAVIKLTSRRDGFDARALAGGYLSHLTGPGSKTVGTYDLGASGGGTAGAVSGFGRAAVHYSGGAQSLVARDALTASGLSATPGLTNDRALRVQLGGGLSVALSEQHKLGIDADFMRYDHGTYVGLDDVYLPYGGTLSNALRVQAYAQGKGRGALNYRVGLGYRLHSMFADQNLTPPGYDGFDEGLQQHITLAEHVVDGDAQIEAKVGSINKLSAHAMVAHHQLATAKIERNASVDGTQGELGTLDIPQPTGLARTQLSVAMNDKLTPLPWLDIDLGVRFSFASDVGLRDLAALITPVAALTFKPLRELLLRLSYDTAARAPTLFERALDNRYRFGRTVALDVLAGTDRFRAELRADYLGSQDAVTFGASGFLRAGFMKRSYVRGGVSWHRATSAGTLLVSTPQLAAVLMALVEVGTYFDLSASMTYYAERRNDAAAALHPWVIPANVVAHAQVRSRAFAGVRFLVIMQNAFDTARQDDVPRADRLPGLLPREGLRLLGGLEYAL